CSNHHKMVAAPHHPYANAEKISLAQLEQAKWVLREQGAGTRRIFEGAIHGVIEKLNVWKEYEHVLLLKALVRNGAYLSCLPHITVEQDVAEGKLVIIDTPQLNLQRQLSFVWRNDAGDNPLRDCVLNEARRMSKTL
ncbi:LysR family transcriptional regulator, partial [Shewanella sp. SG41-4]|uniref:LysR substrate-binding domain-containing protein n=1 Tax=Shewanella sp. SG41-4 TaxID=2760976 RepID=UPI001837730F